MALRSTIVYPLGTIAVQMGAPENLALLKANEQSGLIVGLVVATGDHDDLDQRVPRRLLTTDLASNHATTNPSYAHSTFSGNNAESRACFMSWVMCVK